MTAKQMVSQNTCKSCRLVKSMNVFEKEKKCCVPFLLSKPRPKKERKYLAVNRQQRPRFERQRIFMYLFMIKHSSDLCFFLSPSLVTPLHRCVIMHEGVDESLHKICNYQQNVPQHYYLFDTQVIIIVNDSTRSFKFSYLWFYKELKSA